MNAVVEPECPGCHSAGPRVFMHCETLGCDWIECNVCQTRTGLVHGISVPLGKCKQ